MQRVSFVAIIVTGALAGCGGGDAPPAPAAATRAEPPAACAPIEPGRNDRFLLCRESKPGDRGSFWFRGRGRIPVAYPYDAPAGHWSGGFLSPDGGTLLAQWSAECEVPFAFFVSARGGTPRLVTGERAVEEARRASIAHGWTTSGEAIVEVLPHCAGARPQAESELWLISPSGGEKRRLRAERN